MTVDGEAGRALFYILVEAEGGAAGKPVILWTNVRTPGLQLGAEGVARESVSATERLSRAPVTSAWRSQRLTEPERNRQSYLW